MTRRDSLDLRDYLEHIQQALERIDRLIHHAHVIELSGESYRKKTHTQRLQEAAHKPRH